MERIKAEKRASRTINIFITLMLIAFIGSFVVFYRTLLEVSKAAPPVATLKIIKEDKVQTLCPGDSVLYVLKVDLSAPSTVDVDYTVTNKQSGSVIIFSRTERAIYDHAGEVILQYGWRIPLRPPLQNADNEDIIGSNFWTAGEYRRSMSVTGVEGTFKSSVESVDFRISNRCNNILRREDGT